MEWAQRFEHAKQRMKVVLAQEGKRDTDANVAVFLDTSMPTYNRWKNNRQMPNVGLLITMASKLNLSLDWLLLGVGEPDLRSAVLSDSLSKDTQN